MPNHSPYWACLCPVDPLPLIRWLDGEKAWSSPPSPAKPQRIHVDGLPLHLVQPIVDTVLACWPGQQLVADGVMLGRMKPGQSHPMHTDVQRADWLTRVHVPLVTNPGAWHEFEEERGGCEVNMTRGDTTALAKLPIPFKDEQQQQVGEVVGVRFDGRYTIAKVVTYARFHMEVGKAYSFNTLARHAFGNDGESDRVHLMFDVRRVG